ncbi:glycosyltransferase family 39 protein [Komarekiella sp. 'clone 1']|uniref:Glycosyltransferase family 39 protein n=1 Tax=Komarekiella delphini-convector SJRDD-AB1 TaxID=2593771 RepID=A0AA40SV65_9NOST|nr:glycosyltransferase family 39 protein [Komarekiella delphini-convector]MBD6615876.1 glycosyltransferase family 39 protein [Komarekiella delphini-convector SJRDD-AB1]
MLYRLHLLQPMWRQMLLAAALPYISLLLWILPLLIFSSGENSLMAHDEGLYAWRARQMLDSGDWIAPWGNAHHKTPGPYWLIAVSYKLFGISEASGRIPTMIAAIFSLLLIYEIGKILLGKKVAWLAGAILSVEFLWLQYCRLGTPDLPMILLVLLAIWSLLKAELHPKYYYFWSFLAGLSLGLGFLVRSFMILLPIMALFPYLIWEHRRHRHLANPILYLGLIVGLIPTLGWLWFNWLRYGNLSYGQLFKFVVDLGSDDRNHNGAFFYVWNIPLKSFPWFFLSLLGLVLALRRPLPRYHLILVGFPLVLFAELSLFSTRLPHYSLCLYPFIAMLAAVGLNWLGRIYQIGFTYQNISPQSLHKKGRRNLLTPFAKIARDLPRNLSYVCGVLGIVLILGGIVALTSGNADIRKYSPLGLIVGLAWLIMPVVWIGRYHFGYKFLTARYWVASWLIPCWLALAVAGNMGLLGDYNPVFRAFLQQRAIASILQTHPIYFVQVGGKNAVLLNLYTPIHAQRVETISQVPTFSYAWIYTKKPPELSKPHRVLGTVKDYRLIQVLP